MQQETDTSVCDVLASYLAVDSTAIELQAELRRDYRLNPLELNMLVMLLEDAEGIAIRPADFTPVHTVAQLVQHVRACRARGRTAAAQQLIQ